MHQELAKLIFVMYVFILSAHSPPYIGAPTSRTSFQENMYLSQVIHYLLAQIYILTTILFTWAYINDK